MDRCTTHRVDWVEVLENRRLFCAAPDALLLDYFPMQAAVQVQPQVSTPNIVGTFTGTVNDTNEATPGLFTAVILTQTAGGKITGMVESKYAHEHTHINDFTGTIHGNTVSITTSTTTVSVRVSEDGHMLSGSYAYQGSGDSSTGGFVATRPYHR